MSGCGCIKQSLVGNQVVTTLPYDDCVECAEKHVSTAYMIYMNHGVESPYRQQIIGELVCAGWHTFWKHSTIAKKIRQIRELVSNRQEFLPLMEQTLTFIQEWLKNGNEDQKFISNEGTDHPIEFTPTETNEIMAEVCFSSAMMLSQEMGYEPLNRHKIIGNLALCQHYLYRDYYEFAVKIRDVRHFVQENNEKIIDYDWTNLCKQIDQIVLNSLTK